MSAIGYFTVTLQQKMNINGSEGVGVEPTSLMANYIV